MQSEATFTLRSLQGGTRGILQDCRQRIVCSVSLRVWKAVEGSGLEGSGLEGSGLEGCLEGNGLCRDCLLERGERGGILALTRNSKSSTVWNSQS
ncbi:hypothetical protein ACOMHN_061762 [Nucella lapillus]